MQIQYLSVIYRTKYTLFHSTVASLTIIVRPPVVKSLEGILKSASGWPTKGTGNTFLSVEEKSLESMSS